MQPKKQPRKTIKPEPPGMYRKLWQHGWRQLCGHHQYEWNAVRHACDACRRMMENSNPGK